MKGELRDQKQVNSYGATPVSRDKPYITGYRTTPDSTQPYTASYTSTKHSRPSHHRKVNYITGYRTSTHEVNEPYITGYRTSTHEVNEPYITGYRTAAAHEASQPYITGYRTSAHDSNEPSIFAGYRTTVAHEANQPEFVQYASGAKKDPKESAHDTPEPYITAYDGIGAKKNPKESAHDTTVPYITAYDGIGAKKDPKESTHDSTKPCITQYGIGPKKDPKESTQDSSEPYITQYGRVGSKKDPKESAQDSTKPYVTQYGLRPKKDSKESAQDSSDHEPYITQYGDIGPKKDPKESPNVDHTEAFKTGFFTLDDLYVGNTMTLQFPVQEFSHFLPRKEADSIPFSMSQLASVLQLFSIPEDSPEAKSMKATLEQCEAEPITGETKDCVSSLESMIEFVGTIIGSEANYNILTTSYPTTSGVPLQNYTILKISQDMNAPKWVACHPLPYPYAVYYCHFIGTGSKVFKVLLDGEKGDKMEALGLCHLDTSDWSPDHILFQQLGIKPGEAPVCHFFPVKHLLWVPLPSEATM